MSSIDRPVHGCPVPWNGWRTPCCNKRLTDILLEEPVTVVGSNVTCAGSVENLTQNVQVVTEVAPTPTAEDDTKVFRFTQVPRKVSLEQETVEMAILDATVVDKKTEDREAS